MKLALLKLMCAALLLATVACDRRPAPEARGDELAVRAAWHRVTGAFNRHDAAAWAAELDSSYASWDGEIRGPDAERTRMASYFAQQRTVQHEQLDELGLSFIAPNVALYRTFSVLFQQTNAAGEAQPSTKLLEAWIFVRRESGWKVAMYFTKPTP